MTILVTGAAGFIGYHTAERLLQRGDRVVGLDNLNDYYDVALKEARLARLQTFESFRLIRADLADRKGVEGAFATVRPGRVVHLAAQAGVRHSLTHPHVYASSNLTGFLHILEGCRTQEVEHLVYASTSSVYGANTSMPFSVHQNVDHPLTLYAATKKSNELMAHSYAHLFRIPLTGLRFFTVYGPWGRPDMALFLFTKAMLEGRPIKVFNNGHMERDFTYVDDIAEGVIRALDCPPEPDPTWDAADPDPASSNAPYRIYNIGNSQPTNLMRFIRAIEKALGVEAITDFHPMQPGDVPATWADVSTFKSATGYAPATPVEVGVRRFVEWYRSFYRV